MPHPQLSGRTGGERQGSGSGLHRVPRAAWRREELKSLIEAARADIKIDKAMKRSQLIITTLLLALLLGFGFSSRLPMNYGALPWFGWIALAAFAICLGAGLIGLETARRRRYMLAPVIEAGSATETARQGTAALPPVVSDPQGPTYPHPVINAQTCIGCYACAEACPH